MNTLHLHPFRVLIVDDEPRDWANPMREALEDAAKGVGLDGVKIDVVGDKSESERCLAKYCYHLSSLDMRLPEHKDGAISVTAGVAMARSFPWVGFPKLLVYSQLLRIQTFRNEPADAIQILQLATDLYAKPSGSDDDRANGGIEILKVTDWARRVADSLASEDLELKGSSDFGRRLTVVGAYLHHGVDLLPPFLARHLQTVASHWQVRSGDRVEAAIRFIEATARLALVQSFVLCRAEGHRVEPPSDERMVTCLSALKTTRAQLLNWNWCNYLTVDAIEAFQRARIERNEKGHTLTISDPQRHWAALRSPLQYAMDVASYWVRHPLAVDLRYSRDGWNVELLAGTAVPRRRHLLPKAIDFPSDALRSGVWQSVWRMKDDEPERVSTTWDDWLEPDAKSNVPWWFPAYVDKRGHSVQIDLISGERR